MIRCRTWSDNHTDCLCFTQNCTFCTFMSNPLFVPPVSLFFLCIPYRFVQLYTDFHTPTLWNPPALQSYQLQSSG